MTDAERTRDAILAEVLPNVTFDGWSTVALHAGASSAGIGPAARDAAFPDGVSGLVAHHTDWLIRRAIAVFDAGASPDLRSSQRLRGLLRAYFQVLTPHREAERRRLAWLAVPGNAALGVRLLAHAADSLWWAAGDRSTDFAHYTKRLTLGSILAAATLYWLDDESDGGADTQAFIDRRFADVIQFGRMTARMRDGTGLPLPDPRRFLRQCRRRWGDQSAADGIG